MRADGSRTAGSAKVSLQLKCRVKRVRQRGPAESRRRAKYRPIRSPSGRNTLDARHEAERYVRRRTQGSRFTIAICIIASQREDGAERVLAITVSSARKGRVRMGAARS